MCSKIWVDLEKVETHVRLRISTLLRGGSKSRLPISNISQCFKTKIFNQCVLFVCLYGTETWSLSVSLIKKLKVVQQAMERAILGVSLRDRIKTNKSRRYSPADK